MGSLSSFFESLEPRIAPAAFTISLSLAHGDDGEQFVQVKTPGGAASPNFSNTNGNIPYAMTTPQYRSDVPVHSPNPIAHVILTFQPTIDPVYSPPLRSDFGGPSLDDATSGGFQRVKDFHAEFVKLANRIADLVAAGRPLPYSARLPDLDASEDNIPSNLRILDLA